VLRKRVLVAEALLDEVDILTVVLDTACDNKALAWSDVVHDELLEDTGIEVADVGGHTESWHAQGLVSVGGSEEELSVVCKWVILGEVAVEVVALLIFGLSNIGCND